MTDLAAAAEKSGLVESGKSEVVGRTASKFLNSIRKIEVVARLKWKRRALLSCSFMLFREIQHTIMLRYIDH